MTKVEAIEREVEKFTREELASFRDWFAEHDWNVAAGRLDKFAEEVLEEHRRGRTKEL